MAIEQSLKSFTRQANVDLTAKQFLFVVSNGGKADLPAADGVRTLGVLQDTPRAGDPGAIAFGGVSKVISDGSIEVDKPVAAKTGGQAKEAASGEYIQGT